MEAKVITEIERMIKENQVIEKDGQQYVAQNYRPLRHVDRPDTIHLSTLQSLSEVAKGAHEADFLVITDRLSVQMLSGMHEVDKQRSILAEAAFDYEPYPFDGFITAEHFAILLQTRFVMTEKAAGILAIASKLHIEDGVEVADNGIAQRVTVKKGVSAASLATEVVPSMVSLAPYRIFPECDQVETTFLLRLRGDKDNGASVGLFEADGGLWKVHAKRIIKAKLEELGVTLPIFC